MWLQKVLEFVVATRCKHNRCTNLLMLRWLRKNKTGPCETMPCPFLWVLLLPQRFQGWHFPLDRTCLHLEAILPGCGAWIRINSFEHGMHSLTMLDSWHAVRFTFSEAAQSLHKGLSCECNPLHHKNSAWTASHVQGKQF
jgi:hypothetical protein